MIELTAPLFFFLFSFINITFILSKHCKIKTNIKINLLNNKIQKDKGIDLTEKFEQKRIYLALEQ